jgi:hypothetical protein
MGLCDQTASMLWVSMFFESPFFCRWSCAKRRLPMAGTLYELDAHGDIELILETSNDTIANGEDELEFLPSPPALKVTSETVQEILNSPSTF